VQMALKAKYTKIEIDLKRLLKRCENIVVEDNFNDPYCLKTFHKFLEVANSKLIELERFKKEYDERSVLGEAFDPSVSVCLQKEALMEYSRKIQFLKDLRNSEKLMLGINETPKKNRIIRNIHMTHAEKNTELEILAKVKNAAVQEMRKLLLPEEPAPDKKNVENKKQIDQNGNLQQKTEENNKTPEKKIKNFKKNHLPHSQRVANFQLWKKFSKKM